MVILNQALDIFLMITYLGVSAYLALVYFRWKENTIGLWSLGTYFATFSVFFILIADNLQGNLQDFFTKLGYVLGFVSFSLVGIAHQVARRKNYDLLLTVLISSLLGALSVIFWIDVEMKLVADRLILVRDQSFSNIDIILGLFFITLFVILVRDSEIIYQSSIKKLNKSYYRSTAITHLISWQFFFWGFLLIWYLTKIKSFSSLIPVLYEIPMILLLVPILTLGSRPFDWAREGFQPRMLLLLDHAGNVTFSWQKSVSSPLLLEGATLASIKEMLNSVSKDKLQKMNLTFQSSAMYVRMQDEHLSVLITDGFHLSFDVLLSKIHQLLLTKVIGELDFGKTKTLPEELTWLLKQLLQEF